MQYFLLPKHLTKSLDCPNFASIRALAMGVSEETRTQTDFDVFLPPKTYQLTFQLLRQDAEFQLHLIKSLFRFYFFLAAPPTPVSIDG